MYQVRDVMQTHVIAIPPEATIETAIRVLLEHHISGAPVIDEKGKLRGIISQYQLLEVMYDPAVRSGRVSDFMTRNVLTIDEEALLGAAASTFVVHRIRRIPVVRNGEVVGIISRSDLLRYFLESGEQIDTFFAKLRTTQTPEVSAVVTE